MKKQKDISPTWIRQWCFCPRQWFLFRTTGRKVDVTPESKRGVEFHLNESRKVEAVRRTQTALKVTILAGGVLCMLFWLFS